MNNFWFKYRTSSNIRKLKEVCKQWRAYFVYSRLPQFKSIEKKWYQNMKFWTECCYASEDKRPQWIVHRTLYSHVRQFQQLCDVYKLMLVYCLFCPTYRHMPWKIIRCQTEHLLLSDKCNNSFHRIHYTYAYMHISGPKYDCVSRKSHATAGNNK